MVAVCAYVHTDMSFPGDVAGPGMLPIILELVDVCDVDCSGMDAATEVVTGQEPPLKKTKT